MDLLSQRYADPYLILDDFIRLPAASWFFGNDHAEHCRRKGAGHPVGILSA